MRSSNRGWTEIIPRKISFLGGGLENARIPKVRAPFALFVLLLAGACAQAGGSLPGDGAVDRRGATAADGREAGKECVDPDPVNLNASKADILIVFDGSESMGIAFGAGTRYSVLAEVLSNWSTPIRSGFVSALPSFPGRMRSALANPSLGVALGLLWWGSHPAMARR